VMPLDAAPVQAYPGAHAYPVVRVSATTPGAGAAVLSPTVLGLPREAIRHMHWRSDFSSLSTTAIARTLTAQGEPRQEGIVLPSGARTLTTTARLRGAGVVASAVLEDDHGRLSLARLGRASRRTGVLSARLPAGARRVLGIQLALPTDEAFMQAHRNAEGELAVAPSGELDLGPLAADGRELTDWHGWTLSTGGDVLDRAAGAKVRYSFADTGLHLVLRPVQPTDDRLMPVVVSPDIAHAAGGVGGTTVLDFQDTQINARVVGVARRMPSVPLDTGPFVLADAGWLSTAINSNAPGEGSPSEVWISAPGDDGRVGATLARPPFASLVVASRATEERQLAGDPLAHATAVALGAAGLVALVLAVLGFWVGVVSELHDEKSDFFDLEAQGVGPETIRSHLRARIVGLLAFGIGGGLILGWVLSRLVVSLVQVSAGTGSPEPPLALEAGWPLALATLAVLIAAVIAAVELTTRRALRDDMPLRPAWSAE